MNCSHSEKKWNLKNDKIKALREELEALKYVPPNVEFNKVKDHFEDLTKDS